LARLCRKFAGDGATDDSGAEHHAIVRGITEASNTIDGNCADLSTERLNEHIQTKVGG